MGGWDSFRTNFRPLYPYILFNVLALGMGQRYVISVTKNEERNEAGCYQNHIASHFDLAAWLCRAAILQL